MELVPRVVKWANMKPKELIQLSHAEQVEYDYVSAKYKLPENSQWA